MSSKFGAMALDTEKPVRMVIRHPKTNLPLRDNDGTEAFIDLMSSDSDAAVKAKRTVTNGRLAMRNRSKLTSERLETEAAELLAALTKAWYLVGLDGSVVDTPCNHQNAVDLYTAPEMAWLREQVDEFTSDRANF